MPFPIFEESAAISHRSEERMRMQIMLRELLPSTALYDSAIKLEVGVAGTAKASQDE